MNPRVKNVTPLGNGLLKLEFTSNKRRIFDAKPYFDKNVFVELKQKDVFDTALVFNGTVVWNNELDFCPDALYLKSVSC